MLEDFDKGLDREGQPVFNVDQYVKENIKEKDVKELDKIHKDVKTGYGMLQREMQNGLFEHYECFLKVSDSLKDIHHEFQELKTMLSQCHLCIGGI